MLFTLAVICLFGSVVTAYNVEIVATALYYADSLGRILLICDELPLATKIAIHKDFVHRVKDKYRLRIVPAFANKEDIPYKANILARLRDIFPKVYIADISKDAGIQIMKKLIKKKKLNKRNYVPFNEGNSTLDLSEEYNEDDEEEDTTELYETTIDTNSKPQEPIIPLNILNNPDNYFPNSVIYATENPCVVRSELVDCNQGNNLLTKFISGRKGE